MNVALLKSEQQAKSVNGVEYLDDSFCNPVKDGLGRWVISIEEMQGLELELEIVDWIEPVNLSNTF